MLDGAQPQGQLRFHEFGQLVLRIIDLPIVEVDGLLVVVVQHLFQDCLHAAGERFDEGWGTIRIVDGTQVIEIDILPAGAEQFGSTTAAFAEACIADFAVGIGQDDTTGGLDGLFDKWRHLTGDALVTLTMIVGTDIVEMVVGVVPDLYYAG